jgi:hypothetical protein
VPDQVLALARRGRIAMFVSKPILEAIHGVLKGKFQWPASRTRDALAAISELAKELRLSIAKDLTRAPEARP